MNDGVKILLARMETHPEEFAIRVNYGESQWGALINMFKHCLDKEDIDALEVGTRKCNQEVFTQKVMQSLLDPQENVVSPYTTQGNLTLTGGVIGTIGTSTWGATNLNPSLTIGNTTIEEEQLKQIKAQLLPSSNKSSNKVEVVRKPITKFGKLYTP